MFFAHPAPVHTIYAGVFTADHIYVYTVERVHRTSGAGVHRLSIPEKPTIRQPGGAKGSEISCRTAVR